MLTQVPAHALDVGMILVAPRDQRQYRITQRQWGIKGSAFPFVIAQEVNGTREMCHDTSMGPVGAMYTVEVED